MTTINHKTSNRLSSCSLFLIGFMGTGKSTIAAELAKHLGLEVLEMDETIEKQEGMSIPDIFSTYGEAYFRKLETDLLKETGNIGNRIVSCGGGAAARAENVAEMKKSGVILLLTAAPETILTRIEDNDDRPLLRGRKNTADIAALIASRKPAYDAAADYTISTDNKSVADITQEILNLLSKEGIFA
mgnify:CR=1 FL=1